MIIYKISQSNPNYVLKTDSTNVIVNIPNDPDNTDYQAYLAWVAEGNQPEAAE